MSTPDEFHYHEVLDRISVFEGMLDDFVSRHVVLEHEPELAALVEQAAVKLQEAYQLAGKIKFEKFPDVPAYPATPQEVIAFVGSHFDSMEENVDLSNVRFQLTVHDLLSAFEWWQE